MAGKLKSKQGATIMLALIFLLVATMVSCVILVAASAAARALDRERQQQQAYLTVSSAAQLLAKELGKTQVIFETVTTVGSDGTSSTQVRDPRGEGSDLMAQRVAQAVKTLWKGGIVNEEHFTITHQVKTGGAPQLETVDVTFFMERSDQGRYVVTIRLKNQDPDNPCQLYIRAESRDPIYSESGPDTSLTRANTYTWAPSIKGQEVQE